VLKPFCSKRKELIVPKKKWRMESVLDVINLALGVGLLSIPWIFGFTSAELASRNAWISGVMIAVAAIMALVALAEWEEWINLVLGLWVAISPWVLSTHLTLSENAIRTQVALGLVVALFAAAELWIIHRDRPRIA
jgi:predicted MFS family arabinose efflux permease